jgi:hypothetical protein
LGAIQIFVPHWSSSSSSSSSCTRIAVSKYFDDFQPCATVIIHNDFRFHLIARCSGLSCAWSVVRGHLRPLLHRHRHLCKHASYRRCRSRPWCTITSIREDSRSYYEARELRSSCLGLGLGLGLGLSTSNNSGTPHVMGAGIHGHSRSLLVHGMHGECCRVPCYCTVQDAGQINGFRVPRRDYE